MGAGARWSARRSAAPPSNGDVRELLNAIFYVLWTGCQWKALPKDLPPRSTVWEYLDLWDWDGTLERIHHALYVEVRENAGRERARRRRSSTARPQRVPSTYGPPVCKRLLRSDLSSLHQRIRSQGSTLAKMEIRASRS